MPERPASDRYLHGHHPSVLAAHGTRTAANSAAYLIPHLRPGMRVLDVGCGPGSITLDLAELVAPGDVVGIDPVESALTRAREAARQRAGRHLPSPGAPAASARFAVGDVLGLDFADGSFDVVHAHQVLQHLPDPIGALREMWRVLRPGGLLAVRDADYRAMSWFPESAGMDRWRELYRQLARSAGGEPDAGRRLRSWAASAGLTATAVSASSWCYADPEQCAWWSGSQAERIRTSAFAAQARAAGIEPDELERLAAAWEDWGRSPDAWFVIVHGELLARRAA